MSDSPSSAPSCAGTSRRRSTAGCATCTSRRSGRGPARRRAPRRRHAPSRLAQRVAALEAEPVGAPRPHHRQPRLQPGSVPGSGRSSAWPTRRAPTCGPGLAPTPTRCASRPRRTPPPPARPPTATTRSAARPPTTRRPACSRTRSAAPTSLLDDADREATARREEAEAVYEHQRARAAQAAADFETTLAQRRQRAEADFMERRLGQRVRARGAAGPHRADAPGRRAHHPRVEREGLAGARAGSRAGRRDRLRGAVEGRPGACRVRARARRREPAPRQHQRPGSATCGRCSPRSPAASRRS
nr:hypothetical protein [Angustibacter aerolatus]